MSWYRTYRPQRFSDLIGQEYVSKILLSALRHDALVHAYLFSGSRGTGKTSAARILGKALNCLQRTPEGEPCNKCANCMAADEQRLVDIIEIDAASNTGVDHIRDLRDKVGFSPVQGRAKVYIIDEVHMLSSGAFNALLKTLEEPPAFVYFILATTEMHKVPETIQSRCQRFSFRRITEADIVQRLLFIADQEQITAEKAGLELIARQSGGGLRDAISLFEQYTSEGRLEAATLEEQMGLVPRTLLVDFYSALETGNTSEALGHIDALVREGFSLSEFARAFLLFLREKLLAVALEQSSSERLLSLVEVFEAAQQKIKFAIIPQLPLEVAVLKALPEKSEAGEGRGIFGFFAGEKKKEAIPESKVAPVESASAPAPTELNSGESPKADFLSPEVTPDALRQLWPQILERLKTSLLRMALRNAEIAAFSGENLTLQFPALTWKEQVEKPEHRHEFLSILSEIFARDFTLSCEVKGVQLESVSGGSASTQQATENPTSALAAFQEIMGTTVQREE